MLITLREAIIKRVHGKSKDELIEVIEGSIGGEEQALPGLGVLFEMIWEQCDQDTQTLLANSLKKELDSLEQVTVNPE